jgi:hypothetical protein
MREHISIRALAVFGLALWCGVSAQALTPGQNENAGKGAEMPENDMAKPWQVYWTADHCVDRLDLEHMGAWLRQRGKTDEERALAVWQYMRRTMYHYPMRNENHVDQFDAAKLINVYGYSFCTQQGIAAAAIAQAAGLKARAVSIPGHGIYEVFYDGGWHLFCSEFAFFVYTRGPGRHIASLQEMKEDPTLISQAREEKRTSTPFLPCAGGPAILAEEEGTHVCPYSLTSRYYDERFFIAGVPEWKDNGAPNPSGYSAWMGLRRGESLRLEWAQHGKFLPPKDLPRSWRLAERFWPPRHMCGEKERQNPFFAEVEPYGIEIQGKRTYRYYGNGTHIWRPRLENEAALADLALAENLTVRDNLLQLRNADAPAVAEFRMQSPYAYVAGKISGRISGRGRMQVYFQGSDADMPWIELATIGADQGAFTVELGSLTMPRDPADPAKKDVFNPYLFTIRLVLSGAPTVTDIELTGIVQHNWNALPQLIPGANTIRVRTGAPESAKAHAAAGIGFELCWEESPAIGDPPNTPGRLKTLRNPVQGLETVFPVEVYGGMPRMRYVLMTRP